MDLWVGYIIWRYLEHTRPSSKRYYIMFLYIYTLLFPVKDTYNKYNIYSYYFIIVIKYWKTIN
jgi:hypothetical protein